MKKILLAAAFASLFAVPSAFAGGGSPQCLDGFMNLAQATQGAARFTQAIVAKGGKQIFASGLAYYCKDGFTFAYEGKTGAITILEISWKPDGSGYDLASKQFAKCADLDPIYEPDAPEIRAACGL